MTNPKKSDCFREPIGKVLSRPHIWSIPVYQRHYAWEPDLKKGADPLDIFLDDVLCQFQKRLNAPGEDVHPHYLSAIQVKPRGNSDDSSKSPVFDVVDGQQRIVTVYLSLLALWATVRRNKLESDDVVISIENCVFHDGSYFKFKLNPANFDREDFHNVIMLAKSSSDGGGDKDRSIIRKAYLFLRRRIEEEITKNDDPVSAALAMRDSFLKGLDVTMVYLMDDDDERKIFESLNATGQPLTIFDIVRNRVFSKASKEGRDQDAKLFRSSEWKELENPYWYERSEGGKTSGWTHIESYLIRTLVASRHKYVENDKRRLLKHYVEFANKFQHARDEINALVKYTGIYKHLDSPSDESAKLFGDYGLFNNQIWKSRVWYPVLFLASERSPEEREKVTKMLESFVVRRAVCGLTTNSYNLGAATIVKDLGGNVTPDRLRQCLCRPTSDTHVFPDNNMLIERSFTSNFYAEGNISRYILFKINNEMQRFPEAEVDIAKLQLDHIAPQAWYEDSDWKNAFHGMADFEMADKLHTIGNVTLLSSGNNKIKSNRPWKEAKDTYRQSPLELNRRLAEHEVWGIDKIDARRKEMLEYICKIWPYFSDGG